MLLFAVVLNPKCYSTYPFTSQLYEMIISLCLVTALAAAFAVTGIPFLSSRLPKAVGKVLPLLKRFTMTWLTLGYALICNTTLSMINCVPGRIDISTFADAFPRYRSASVLSSNKMIECYVGDHKSVAVLAWFVLFLHVLGFPLLTFLFLRSRRLVFHLQDKAFKSIWINFITGDFHAEKFWFVHLNMFLLFMLSIILTCASAASAGTQAGAFIGTLLLVSGFICLLYLVKPYRELKAWKMPVKALVLVVTGMRTLLMMTCACWSTSFPL